MAKFEAIDHFDGSKINWPVPDAKLKYDFLFRKKGDKQWRYMNSSDLLNTFDEQATVTTSHGGEYLILESRTGKPVKS